MGSGTGATDNGIATTAEENLNNLEKLESQVNELLVSSHDPVVGKTIWQCAQCHFSAKSRYTVKQHIETHITDFTHQCPQCEKTFQTRNGLRTHLIRAHNNVQNPRPMSNNAHNNAHIPMGPDGMMEVQFAEMGSPAGSNSSGQMVKMPKQRRPRQPQPWDEELERQIRLLLVSNYDPIEVKTTWSCAQCNFTSKLKFTAKQHVETHITNIVHQCSVCSKTVKTRNALRSHMARHGPSSYQAPPSQIVKSPQWMGHSSPGQSPGYGGNQFVGHQTGMQQQRQPRKQRDPKTPRSELDLELDRRCSEYMVSNFDALTSKTNWQCTQCQFSSKIKSTMKEHVETHITEFTHQCPFCQKICTTRNALRGHTLRAHKGMI